MRIQHNIMAMNAYRNYNTNTSALSKNLEKLSSGYKINRAGDDAAGLAISEKMRAQITGLNAAQKNVKDGISLVKTAEGAMQEIQDMLNRMDYLATQSANGTYDDPVDRYNLQKEVNQLRSEINRIADSANFNGIKLLDGSQGASNTAALDSIAAATVNGVDASPVLGAAVSINDKFATTTANNAMHLEDGTAQTTPKFSIDLSGVTVACTGDTGANFSITVAGKKIDIAVTGTTNGSTTYSAAQLATQLNGKEVSIQGISFTMKNSGNEVVFTMTTGETYTTTEAANLLAQLGSQVDIGASAGDVTVTGAQTNHAITEITKPVAEVAGSVSSGIDLTLDSTIVSQGSKLTLGGTTFVFKTDKNADPATATGDVVIDVSGVDASKQIQEAVIKMTNHTDITEAGDLGGNGKFELRASGTNTIHVEQKDVGTSKYTSRDELLTAIGANFQLCTGGSATKGGADIVLDESKFQLGDRVKVGNTTYVLADQTDSTAASDATERKVSFADLKAAVITEVGNAVGTDKYDVTATDAGISVRAKAHGTDDSSAALSTVMTKVNEVISSIKSDSSKAGLTLQIGDTSDSFNQLNVKVGDMHTYAMGTMADRTSDDAKETVALGDDGQPLSIANININTRDGASAAINVIKNAINYVSSIRGDLGATQNRLEHTANNLSVMAENIQDAESTIRDTDIAEEMMSYTKNNILVQSAQAMLAQANAVPQGVLQLLG